NTYRLGYIEKYKSEFPKESVFLEKSEIAYFNQLGSGTASYLRKAYENYLITILNENNIDIPKTFKAKLDKVNEVSDAIPKELQECDYGYFGELSDLVHVNAD
ncbi:hypothetical protein, partial [Pseudomonas aeruginosa]|uniref:hypothetical protein n=1 Tax=Pseudomonas aeruginosa TaxID=287 RepID=UPI00374A88C0